MRPLIFGGLISFLINFLIGFFVIFKNPRGRVNRAFFCLSFNTAVWSSGSFLVNVVRDKILALWLLRGSYIFGVFLLPAFLYFVYSIIEEELNFRLRLLLTIVSFVFIIFLFTPFFIKGFYVMPSGHYISSPGPIYYLFIMSFTLVGIFGILKLIKALIPAGSVKNMQLRYIIIAYIIAMFSGFIYFLEILKIVKIFALNDYIIIISILIIMYAIVRHRLMDITVAITRATIFVFVYTLVLGIPFWAGVHLLDVGLWLFPVSLMAVFATIGPFVYLYFQRRAEARLLLEQHQYQFTLRRASLGMGRIKDLTRLLKLIVHVVTRTVRIENCSIYLFHEASNQFILKASKGKDIVGEEQSTLLADSALINYLKKIKEPLVYEELRQKSLDYGDKEFIEVEKEIRIFNTELVLPSYIEDKLLAIILLGKKISGKLYSQEDLVVFSILANQSALAIENAQFCEDTKKIHEQLFEAEKMATIGTMADGLSHQINNRLHAMGFIAGDVLDTIRIQRKNGVLKVTDELLGEIEHGLTRIQDNVKRGGEIVEGLMKYTRKGDQGFESVKFEKLINAALEMAQFKIKLSEIEFVKDYNESIPEINGNFTQLQEVFFNIIDNSYDAIMQRKEERKEIGYKGQLEVTVNKRVKTLEILMRDNGIGVRDIDRRKLFTPFFTTKLSNRKGTGLGLYVIRQIIEENHHGKVRFASVYGEGSQMQILLPIAN